MIAKEEVVAAEVVAPVVEIELPAVGEPPPPAVAGRCGQVAGVDRSDAAVAGEERSDLAQVDPVLGRAELVGSGAGEFFGVGADADPVPVDDRADAIAGPDEVVVLAVAVGLAARAGGRGRVEAHVRVGGDEVDPLEEDRDDGAVELVLGGIVDGELQEALGFGQG